MKKLILTTLCVLGALMMNAQSMYVTSTKDGNVNLRTAPSTTASKAGVMSSADLLPYLDETGDYETGWYKVSAGGREAYVSKTVATTIDAEIPGEMYGKTLESAKPRDQIRFQGTLSIEKIDSAHAFISVEWMRANLPAETYNYIAEIKDGKIVATHQGPYVDTDQPLDKIMEDMWQLEKPLPVGYSEFNSSLIFDGTEFSEYD